MGSSKRRKKLEKNGFGHLWIPWKKGKETVRVFFFLMENLMENTRERKENWDEIWKKKVTRKMKNRFQVHKLFLYIFLNSFNLFSFFM